MISEMRKYVKFQDYGIRKTYCPFMGPILENALVSTHILLCVRVPTLLISIIISRKQEAVLQQQIIEMRKKKTKKKKHNNIYKF